VDPVTLLHFDGSWTDTGAAPSIWTPENAAALSATAPKFGSGCADFSSFGSQLTTPFAAGGPLDLHFTSWTFQSWVRRNSGNHFPSCNLFSDGGPSTSENIDIYLQQFGALEIDAFGAGKATTNFVPCGGNPVPFDGAWHHVAVQVDAVNHLIQGWIDGTSFGVPPGVFAPFTVAANGTFIYLGGYPRFDNGHQLDGQADEICITRGLVYPMGADFAPPAAPFTLTPAIAVSANITEGADFLAATTALAIAPTVAVTEQPDTLAATAALAVAMRVAVTEGPDTVAATEAQPPAPPLLEKDLRNFLLAAPSIQALVGSRVYGILREPGAALPAVMIQRSHTARQELFCGVSGLADASMQIDSYAINGEQVWALAKALRLLFKNLKKVRMGATLVDKMFLANEFPMVDPDPGILRVVQLYNVWYLED